MKNPLRTRWKWCRESRSKKGESFKSLSELWIPRDNLIQQCYCPDQDHFHFSQNVFPKITWNRINCASCEKWKFQVREIVQELECIFKTHFDRQPCVITSTPQCMALLGPSTSRPEVYHRSQSLNHVVQLTVSHHKWIPGPLCIAWRTPKKINKNKIIFHENYNTHSLWIGLIGLISGLDLKN